MRDIARRVDQTLVHGLFAKTIAFMAVRSFYRSQWVPYNKIAHIYLVKNMPKDVDTRNKTQAEVKRALALNNTKISKKGRKKK